MSQATIDRVACWVSEGVLSEEAGRALAQWLSEPDYADFVPEIEALVLGEDLDELEDAFRTQLEFGTGGIRGKMGPGPNRINPRTIGAAAQGLARYIQKSGGTRLAEGGVAIAFDTRANSERFARETAAILAGNGVVSHIFPGCRSTPELSFAVRELGAAAGVVISASHNPPTDNGFKAYWTDGGQVVPPHDRNVIAEVQAVDRIDRADYEQAASKGTIRVLGAEIDRAYHERLAGISLSDERDVCIVYTPLHGVGATSVVPALQVLGFADLHLVEEQAIQDGGFPTVAGGVANPEDPAALTLAVRKAAQVDADIAMASDPDADRLGCALPHPECGWDAAPEDLVLNGNQ
ncbi:MAG: phospho-sugar mutase, partial [Candidatus Latescibacteria bacterium]|nr:phospho-sugar mutase [Candidatus Latescibacterota bacterium]